MVSIIRDTLPDKIAYRRFTPENCELFSEVDEYIREIYDNGFDYEVYFRMLKWIAALLDKSEESEAGNVELLETSWNAVAFRNVTRRYVDKDELDDDSKTDYDKVRNRDFKIESYDYIWSVKDEIQKIRAKYGLDDTAGAQYQENELGDWRIIIANKFVK